MTNYGDDHLCETPFEMSLKLCNEKLLSITMTTMTTIGISQLQFPLFLSSCKEQPLRVLFTLINSSMNRQTALMVP